MTIIVTHFDRFGVVVSSDSNVVRTGETKSKPGKKVFRIPRLRAGMAVAGGRAIGRFAIDTWLKRFNLEHGSKSLEEYAHSLRDEIDRDLLDSEREAALLIQIGGYSSERGKWHPELWYIRNASIDQVTGDYRVVPELDISEDFWRRDCPEHDLATTFMQGGSWTYVNGYASGRTSFFLTAPAINQVFHNIWTNPSWSFRPPTTSRESALVIKLYIQIVSTMFQLSDYPASYIGGQVQTCIVGAPRQVVMNCVKETVPLPAAG